MSATISSLNTSVSNLLAQLTTISGNAANIANIANYYSGLQTSLAVVNGVLSSAGLILAFDLKENRFDPVVPLVKTPPSGTTSFNTLSLNYNNTLTVDPSNKLSINTSGFLTSPESDLGLVANASAQTTVVLKTISQPMTCQSSLNVSGNFICNSITSPTITNINTNISILQTTQASVLNNLNTGFFVSGTSQLGDT